MHPTSILCPSDIRSIMAKAFLNSREEFDISSSLVYGFAHLSEVERRYYLKMMLSKLKDFDLKFGRFVLPKCVDIAFDEIVKRFHLNLSQGYSLTESFVDYGHTYEPIESLDIAFKLVSGDTLDAALVLDNVQDSKHISVKHAYVLLFEKEQKTLHTLFCRQKPVDILIFGTKIHLNGVKYEKYMRIVYSEIEKVFIPEISDSLMIKQLIIGYVV